MNREPEVRTAEEIQRHEGFQALTPVTRPSYWGVDLDMARRPGVPMEREPMPFPNTRFPIEQQQGRSTVPMHGRPNKKMPPVFGTATPMHGLSGLVRKAAYKLPDHKPSHWLMKMAADRVDSFGYHAKKALPVALPLLALALLIRRGERFSARKSRPEVEPFNYRGEEVETVPPRAEVTYAH